MRAPVHKRSRCAQRIALGDPRQPFARTAPPAFPRGQSFVKPLEGYAGSSQIRRPAPFEALREQISAASEWVACKRTSEAVLTQTIGTIFFANVSTFGSPTEVPLIATATEPSRNSSETTGESLATGNRGPRPGDLRRRSRQVNLEPVAVKYDGSSLELR